MELSIEVDNALGARLTVDLRQGSPESWDSVIEASNGNDDIRIFELIMPDNGGHVELDVHPLMQHVVTDGRFCVAILESGDAAVTQDFATAVCENESIEEACLYSCDLSVGSVLSLLSTSHIKVLDFNLGLVTRRSMASSISQMSNEVRASFVLETIGRKIALLARWQAPQTLAQSSAAFRASFARKMVLRVPQEFMAAALAGLAENNRLESLVCCMESIAVGDIVSVSRNNTLADPVAAAFGNFLHATSSLQYLELQEIGFTETAVQHFSSLATCKCLTRLSIIKCLFANTDVLEQFLVLLDHNSEITEFAWSNALPSISIVQLHGPPQEETINYIEASAAQIETAEGYSIRNRERQVQTAALLEALDLDDDASRALLDDMPRTANDAFSAQFFILTRALGHFLEVRAEREA